MTTLPVRGAGVRELDLPLPPARMPPLRGLRPLEAVALRGRVRARIDAVRGQRARRGGAAAVVGRGAAGRAAVRGAAVASDLLVARLRACRRGRLRARRVVHLDAQAGGGVRVRGPCDCRTANYSFEGDYGFVDESAGYHARHTAWRWSAGVGRRPRTAGPWPGTWSPASTTRPSRASAPCGSTACPRRFRPSPFAADLSAVGDLRFSEWSAREDHTQPAGDA